MVLGPFSTSAAAYWYGATEAGSGREGNFLWSRVSAKLYTKKRPTVQPEHQYGQRIASRRCRAFMSMDPLASMDQFVDQVVQLLQVGDKHHFDATVLRLVVRVDRHVLATPRCGDAHGIDSLLLSCMMRTTLVARATLRSQLSL